ncbi:MAG: DNA repair protein [Desulfobacteraceae bacterium]|nr:DNA repair protein [Desulfobacteraceae bacterium]MBU4504394.1 DNA repair protein [Pseudomonadota bacterium]
MKKSTLLLNNVYLKPSQIHKFRGFIGNLFKHHDLIHNHDLKTGKPIYRYPLIQFKLIDDMPAIIAITDRAVSIFSEIFMKLDKIIIEDTVIPVFEKDLKVEEVEFGYSDEIFMYEFASPWIGLNQKNYKKYNDASNDEKNEMLKRVMTGNILSMAKYLDCWLSGDQKIKIDHKLKEVKVNLKGKSMTAFHGIFKTNFLIPDYLGIGKSVSRGFGAVRRVI